MSPEAQRIAIAEACGITLTADGAWYWENRWQPFDPLFDLNAMHEAEKVLEGWQVVNYKDNLREIVGKGEEPSAFDLLHTTSSQRAEAFLRTLNLWDETK